MSDAQGHDAQAKPSLALLAFVLLCSAALWWGRVTPDAPPASEDEEAQEVFVRTLEWVERDTANWQREHGDRRLPWSETTGQLAIVIDDVGRELDAHEKLQALRYPLTFSVLPKSVYAAGAQLRLREDERRYRELWLHLPMQPRDSKAMQEGQEAQEAFLLMTDDEATLRRKIDAALKRVPTAVGVNNHMGSALTTDEPAMRVVLDELKRRELLFMDSRTHHDTVGMRVAAKAGVPAAERKVFLDHDPSPAAMRRALQEAIERSKVEPVVAIGHPSRALSAVLEAGLSEAFDEGVGVFPLSELIAHQPATMSVSDPSKAPIDAPKTVSGTESPSSP